MALYRETATGFVQEYASNPGAGYTLISTMPTASIDARAEWWRDLDKWNQTSAWHPSLGSTAEDPNDNFLQIVFTNDSALVSSDADGNVTDGFLGATTQVRVMRGSQNVTLTEGWLFGLAKSPDVPAFTYTWTGTGTDVLTLQITGFPTDTTSGYISITATRTGSTDQVKDFKFLKVIRGIDGSSGVVIDLSNEAHVVPTDGNGSNGNFTGCTTTASIFVGSTDTSASWTWTATPSSGLSGTASNSNRTYTVSALSVDTGTVTFVASRTGFPNQTAIFTVSKAKGGIAYALQTSASAVNKNLAGQYTPSTITASAIQTTTSGVSAYSGRFRVETQATRGGAWTVQYNSASNETSTTYTVPASIVTIRFTLFSADGTSSQLDQEAIPVTFDGANGSNGDDGVRGSRQIVVDGTSWSDAAAWNGIVSQTGTNPVLTDLVTIANAGAGFSASKFYTGGAYDGDWITPNAYINGNLLVTGTVGADKIVSGSITTTQLNFNPVTTGNVVASINATAEGIRISGSRINIDGTVSFGAGYDPTGKITSGGAATDINNNTTTISGGKITTNSIAADKIVSNSITTSQLNFTPVTAGNSAADINAYTTTIDGAKITTGTLNADKIIAGTITADRLVLGGIDATRLAAGSFSGSIQNIETGGQYFGNYWQRIRGPLTLPVSSVSRQAVLINVNLNLYNTLGLDGFYIDSSGAYIRDPSGAINRDAMKCSFQIRKNGTTIYYVFHDLPFLSRSSVVHMQCIDTAGGTNSDYYEVYAVCENYLGFGLLHVSALGSFSLIEFKR